MAKKKKHKVEDLLNSMGVDNKEIQEAKRKAIADMITDEDYKSFISDSEIEEDAE